MVQGATSGGSRESSFDGSPVQPAALQPPSGNLRGEGTVNPLYRLSGLNPATPGALFGLPGTPGFQESPHGIAGPLASPPAPFALPSGTAPGRPGAASTGHIAEQGLGERSEGGSAAAARGAASAAGALAAGEPWLPGAPSRGGRTLASAGSGTTSAFGATAAAGRAMSAGSLAGPSSVAASSTGTWLDGSDAVASTGGLLGPSAAAVPAPGASGALAASSASLGAGLWFHISSGDASGSCVHAAGLAPASAGTLFGTATAPAGASAPGLPDLSTGGHAVAGAWSAAGNGNVQSEAQADRAEARLDASALTREAIEGSPVSVNGSAAAESGVAGAATPDVPQQSTACDEVVPVRSMRLPGVQVPPAVPPALAAAAPVDAPRLMGVLKKRVDCLVSEAAPQGGANFTADEDVLTVSPM
jgi:hypothetical protein